MDKILATHADSLIGPPGLLSFRVARERSESVDQAAYEKSTWITVSS